MNILFVGMPATGKTSFLAALRHYVDSDIESKRWRQYKEASNTEYINRIHDRWLDCEIQDRTRQEQGRYNQVEIYLENTSTSDQITLSIPDIEGEAFAQQWQSRFWSKNYQSEVESSSGILFFINPRSIILPALLTGTQGLVDDSFFQSTPDEYIPWSPDLAPTQVILVELLQFHNEFINNTPFPIAIIISAWDVVKEEEGAEITPNEWLRLNLPLLDQYFKTNTDTYTPSVYGVSAQGGDLSKANVQDGLRQMDEPAKRIIVQTENNINHDIIAPIQWMLDTWRKDKA